MDFYLQSVAPSDETKRANWLPTAAGKPFTLMLRVYSPRDEVLDGTWTPALRTKTSA